MKLPNLTAFLGFSVGLGLGLIGNLRRDLGTYKHQIYDSLNKHIAPVEEDEKVVSSTMHILYALSGNKTAFLSEFKTSLQSVLLNSPLDQNLTIHIVADDPAYKASRILLLDELHLNEWKTRKQIHLNVYNTKTKESIIHQQLNNFTSMNFGYGIRKHTVGVYFRLFSHLFITSDDVENILYIDTDVGILNNLGGLEKHKNRSSLFQWGESQCAGFLYLNLKLSHMFWNLAHKIDRNDSVVNPHRNVMNDQRLLRLIATHYPHMVSTLPTEWDIHAANFVKNMDQNPGYIHLNGGARGENETAFHDHSFMTNENNKYSWWAVKYYVHLPWRWAKAHLECEITSHGYPLLVDFIT